MKEHLFMIGIVAFFTVLGIISAQNAFGLEAQGRAPNSEQAVENSHVAAHFQCNRKGLWADLDALKVTKVDREQYKLPGGRKAVTTYLISVSFPCTPDYARYPTE